MILRHFQPFIPRLLLGARGGAEDAVQEALISLARNPPDPGDALCASHGIGAWLTQVTRNHCFDMTRSDTRRRAREDAAVLERPEASFVIRRVLRHIGARHEPLALAPARPPPQSIMPFA